MRKNVDRLRSFGEEIRVWPGVWHVMEFRHDSWFDADVGRVMEDFGMVNCISDSGSFPRWDAVTAPAVYVRLHGKPNTYWDWYSEEELQEWAQRVGAWSQQDYEVFVFFDNDAQGAAPWNALKLKELYVSTL